MFHGSPLILVIEDDAVFRQLMLAYLELWGARVLEADTAAEGLNQAISYQPDVVITDLLLESDSGIPLIRQLKRQLPSLPIIAISSQKKLSVVAQALRAGAEDYLIKPIRQWRAVEEAIIGCLEPDLPQLCQELNDHVKYFSQHDIAASRLCQSWQQLPERNVGKWQLSCRQSSPWLLTDYIELEQDMLLLLAEFNPLDKNSPVLMTLLTLVLHEPLRQDQNSPEALLNSPAKTLEYINQLLLNAGLTCHVNLALFRLQAKGSEVQLANGGMQGNKWLRLCNVGTLGIKNVTASPLSYPCALPFALRVQGGFGGEIQVTARHNRTN